MGKNKLLKFDQISQFSNVVENLNREDNLLSRNADEHLDFKGKWSELLFGNNNPLVLELACGGGAYTLGLAERYPDINFLGVDIKGNRIWQGASVALEKGIKNAAFFRTRIEFIEQFFEKDEVSNIWITFPDPFLRKSKSNRRLSSPYFIGKYRHFLAPTGAVHLKTDEIQLYDFTLEVIEEDDKVKSIVQSDDIYAQDLIHPDLDIKTKYEIDHLANGKTIKFVKFSI